MIFNMAGDPIHADRESAVETFGSAEDVLALNIARERPAAAHSIHFRNVCILLLAAIWGFVLLDDALHSGAIRFYHVPVSLLWIAMAGFTVATVLGVGILSHRARIFDAKCDSERLLFEHARDPMSLVRVDRSPGENGEAALGFFAKAQNPAAIERFRYFGEHSSYANLSIADSNPEWLLKKIRGEYSACVELRQERRYDVCSPDGRLVHETIATPVLDPTGTEVSHIIVIMRDMLERKQHERKLADAVEQAETASKSKSQFLASMSHELRTPLNAILGYSELLSLGIGGDLSDKHKEYAQHIHESGSHLLSIIGDILDLSKIEAGQFELHEERTSLMDLIDACVLMVKGRLSSKGLALKMELPDELPLLRVDPLRLKQVIINILSNAIKFTEKGHIAIRAHVEAANGLTVTVSDTGIGMTEAEMKIALEPFGQVQSAFARNHEGTGLGLPIARHLMELHGGQLLLSSSKNVGTMVSITIPSERIVITDGYAKASEVNGNNTIDDN